MARIYSALIPDTSATTRTEIAQTLKIFGEPILRYALERGTTIHPLRTGERYTTASPALARLGIDVDVWPAPPAGLFVVEERVVYLRSLSPMTVAHEFGHAIDCVLGGGVYRSGIDPAIRGCFAAARSFVTPYAATGLDEYFAEAIRAYVEVNDPVSSWPAATRARLAAIDPTMFQIVETIFAQVGGG